MKYYHKDKKQFTWTVTHPRRFIGTGDWNSVKQGQQFAIHAIPSTLQMTLSCGVT
jgi:hypothetical protein